MKTKMIAVSVVAAMLVACGGGDSGTTAFVPNKPNKPNKPNVEPEVIVVKGSIDPSIVVVEVCYDLNDNQACDDGEPTAYTNDYRFEVEEKGHKIVVVTDSGTVVVPDGDITPVSVFADAMKKRFPDLSDAQVETYIRANFFLNNVTDIYTEATPQANAAIENVLSKFDTVKTALGDTYVSSDNDAIVQFLVQSYYYVGNRTAFDSALSVNTRANIDIIKKGIAAANAMTVLDGVGYELTQATDARSTYATFDFSGKKVMRTEHSRTASWASAAEREFLKIFKFSSTVMYHADKADYEAFPTLDPWDNFSPVNLGTPYSPRHDYFSKVDLASNSFTVGTETNPVRHTASASKLDISGIPMRAAVLACSYNMVNADITFARIPADVVFPEGSSCYNLNYAMKADEFITSYNEAPAGYKDATGFRGIAGINTQLEFMSARCSTMGLGSTDCYSIDELTIGTHATFQSLVNYFVGTTTRYGGIDNVVSTDIFSDAAFGIEDFTNNVYTEYLLDRNAPYASALTELRKGQLTATTIVGNDARVLEGGTLAPTFMMEHPNGIRTGFYMRKDYPSNLSRNALSEAMLNETALTAIYPYL